MPMTLRSQSCTVVHGFVARRLFAGAVVAFSLSTGAVAQNITEYIIPSPQSAPLAIATGPDGALWFTEYQQNKIGRITTAGDITEFIIPSPQSAPVGIAAGPDGALWFTESAQNKIGRITMDGDITEFRIHSPGSFPQIIVAGPDGAMWFAEFDQNKIARITMAGKITEFIVPTPQSGPQFITAGPDGALWFTEFQQNQIGRITTTGEITEYVVPSPQSAPGGIVAGPDGALWFTEYQQNKIGRITTGGTFTEFIIPSPQSASVVIAAGPDGALWFTERQQNQVGRITVDGDFTEFVVPAPQSSPDGIVAGPDGAIWFTEFQQNNIGRLMIDHVGSRIAAGDTHTCALTVRGAVKCWGDNRFGELGDGTTTNHAFPTDVSGLASGELSVAVGANHSCALIRRNGVMCWGFNGHGELGNGTTTNQPTPVDVTDLARNVIDIAAGDDHTCALTKAGSVRCWGVNSSGQLGDGTTTERHTPVAVKHLSGNVIAIAAGGNHTCALTVAAGVKCWGDNSSGQLGDGTMTNGLVPVDVSGLTSGATAVTAGELHTCALTELRGVMCWGDNRKGGLGDGTRKTRVTPVDVRGLTSGVNAVTAGNAHTCALALTGGLKCWGANDDGGLGDGSTTDRLTPVDVSGLTDSIAAVVAGGEHTCALTSAGDAECWGLNNFGQLGDGTTKERLTPVKVKQF